MQAQQGPAATIKLELVSDQVFMDVIALDVTRLVFGSSQLKITGVEYPASFSPPGVPSHYFPPLPVGSPDALRTPGYVFNDAVDLQAGPLFRWLLEAPAGAQGPFTFTADLSVAPFDEDLSPLKFSAQTTLATVPEPETWSLLAAAGLAGLLFGGRRSRPGRRPAGRA